MRLFFLSLCALFLVSQVSAQVTSINSNICGSSSGFSTNAYQFRYQGRVLVLASADYILNDTGACHTLNGDSLRLLKSDWAAGLALFENTRAVDAPEIQWGESKLLKKVMFAPGQGSGVIQANKSDRHEFGLQKDVLEIGRLCISPKLVGRPLFDYEHGEQVVGFVSSQFIEMVPGRAARLTRFRDFNWGGVDCAEAPLIALSAGNVKVWVDQTLAQLPSHGAMKALFSWEVPSQLRNEKKINWGPLSLTENCPSEDDEDVKENYPIGGGDPFGIGGMNSSLPCKFAVALNGSTDPITGPYAAFAQEMQELLQKNKTVEVYLGYKRVNDLLVNRGFVSAGDFFKTLLVGDYQFVLMTDGQRQNPVLTPLQAKARVFRRNLQNYSFDSPDRSFRNRGYLVSLLLESPRFAEVTRQDLEGLRRISPWREYDNMIDEILNVLDGEAP